MRSQVSHGDDALHTTEQLKAALADRYTIERLVGEGGMATVYLARDIRHNRQVALKVLKPDLGAIVGVERFLSEIQVTANLQHPNLLPLFDSGAANGLLFYVMPFIEGESLRARLDREKQLPVEDALHIATACASALDYAHRRGVIHRDLKPENILLHEGQPVVADFGIALAVSNAGGNRITQTGLSLGTPQYMSPEQATGDRTIDARTDVYSLGAVTYEMLAGEAPHTGSTSQAIIARVLTEKPRSIRASRPNVPAHVEGAVEHALEKLPADRWASAKEFSEALTGARPVATTQTAALAAAATTATRARPRARELAAWGIATAAALALVASQVLKSDVQTPVSGRFAILLPDSVTVYTGSGTKLAMSADGKQMLVLGDHPTRPRAIYLRRLADPVAEAVRGTDSAASPSFSPDGEWLIFSYAGGVRKVPVVGGKPFTIVDTGGSPSWGDRGRVLYTRGPRLWLTSSDGGERRMLLEPDTARGVAVILWPHMLPGGDYALVTFRPVDGGLDAMRIGVVSIDDGKLVDLGLPGTNAHYVDPGLIVFGRPGGEVYAAPFSLRKRRVTGPAVLLIQDVWQGGGGATGIDVSRNGTLVYHAGIESGEGYRMVSVSRDGGERLLTREVRLFREPRASPDGKRIVARIGPTAAGGDLWIHEIATGALTRLTTDSISMRGEWTRDGARVVFKRLVTPDSNEIASRPWDRPGGMEVHARVVGRSENKQLQEISIGPAHGWSLLRLGGSANNPDIFIAPTDSLWAMRALVSSPADEHGSVVSPNGRMAAYASNETGAREVYLIAIPDPGPRIPVSIGGGDEPMWSRDGTTLFYRGPSHMMAATIAERPALRVALRDSLFRDPYLRYTWHAAYDVFADGRFLMLASPTSASTQAVTNVFLISNLQQMAGLARDGGEGR